MRGTCSMWVGDRSGRERVIKYIQRPPLSAERLSVWRAAGSGWDSRTSFVVAHARSRWTSYPCAHGSPRWCRPPGRTESVFERARAGQQTTTALPKPTPEPEADDAGCDQTEAPLEPGAAGGSGRFRRARAAGPGRADMGGDCARPGRSGSGSPPAPKYFGELRFRAPVQDPLVPSVQGVFRVRRSRPPLSSVRRSWARGGGAR